MEDQGMTRWVLHMDMDAFFAQIEQRVNPALRGKPVLVGARPGQKRTVVAAASYEAKRRGVKSGMSSHEALGLCPDAVFVPADITRYVDVSERLFVMLQRYTPQVESASVDEFFLDITRTAERWGGPVALARDLKKQVMKDHGLTCTVGVAPNKLLSKWVAKRHKPDGLSLLEHRAVRESLERVPVGELYGVGPELRGRLRALGIMTCGELARHPVGELVAHFGVGGYHLSAIGRGEDSSPVRFSHAHEDPKSVGHTQTLPRNVTDLEALKSWLLLQCERVAVRLRRKNLSGRVVSLVVRDSSLVFWSRQRRYKLPTQETAEIFRRASALFPEQWRGRSYRLVGVSVSDLQSDRQMPLMEEDQRRRRLIEAQDRINRRFGEFTVMPARVVKLGE